ncbi:MAG: methyltransferase domain-containing protein [Bacteroidota bacterium]
MNLQSNADRFSGEDYIRTYDRFRPKPPVAIFETCLQYLGKEKAGKMIDLGCGTATATLMWAELADEAIGVDPSDFMLEFAREKAPDLSFVKAFGHKLPFESESLDVVLCSQSFHWMEPKGTIAEVSRVLKPGGVFCVYDALWPPMVHPVWEAAYQALFDNINRLIDGLSESIAHRFPRQHHLENLKNSGHFYYCRKAQFHQAYPADRAAFEGLAISQGHFEALLKRGFSDTEIGLDVFQNSLRDIALPPDAQMTFPYEAYFSIK